MQACGVLDGGGLGVGLRVDVGRVEDVRRVLVVVLRPVRHRAQGGAGLERARFAEQRHERHEAAVAAAVDADVVARSEEHTSELQSLMRNSYAVFCLKKKTRARHKQT